LGPPSITSENTSANLSALIASNARSAEPTSDTSQLSERSTSATNALIAGSSSTTSAFSGFFIGANYTTLRFGHRKIIAGIVLAYGFSARPVGTLRRNCYIISGELHYIDAFGKYGAGSQIGSGTHRPYRNLRFPGSVYHSFSKTHFRYAPANR